MESGKIIVVANQKGGVAKTSTVRNLSYALAEMGKKVLVVDFDPQYNLTTSFGVLPTQAPYNTGAVMAARAEKLMDADNMTAKRVPLSALFFLIPTILFLPVSIL